MSGAAVRVLQDGHVDVPLTEPHAVEALRGDLAGFTVDAVTELLGPVAHAALSREQPVPAMAVLSAVAAAGGPLEPLATLVTALVVGRPVLRRGLDAALPRLGTDGAVRLGLVEAAGTGPDDEVTPLVDLRPYAAVDSLGTADWWVVSDLDELATGAPLRTDHVLGVGGASVTLARCAVRRPVGRVLDVGTGCGVQALHAGRHAERVTGTDVSPRALAFARFTCALNGVRVELRQGDLFRPVDGERFDQVVSNPPFVITPRRRGVPTYDYRDGGKVGDDLVRDVVTGIGAVMADGGTAQVLGNWEHHRGRSWADRVGGWLDQAGLDGWVVQREVQDPAEYAELWIRDGGRPDRAGYDALYRAWLEDFAARGVEAIGFGLLVLRRPRDSAGVTLRRLEDVSGSVDQPLGEHLADCLDAHDWLTRTDDEALMSARLTVATDVTEERYHRPGDQDPQVVLLRQGGGFGRAVRADTALAGFVGACDGELTAGQLTAALGQLLATPTAVLTASLLPQVRALLADGLLIPPTV
jgi:methylase of polypeptide subunit release factors